MPQSVVTYLDNNLDFEKSDIEKRDILNLYRNDIKKQPNAITQRYLQFLKIFQRTFQLMKKKSFSAKSLKMPPWKNMMNHFFGWMIL